MDVQADLRLCWSHRFYCRFCRALAHIAFNLFLFVPQVFFFFLCLGKPVLFYRKYCIQTHAFSKYVKKKKKQQIRKIINIPCFVFIQITEIWTFYLVFHIWRVHQHLASVAEPVNQSTGRTDKGGYLKFYMYRPLE